MSNLIITIISIALVAVATMMAVYYGGSAYENATAQAAANQMISDAQQIAAAYQLYSNANGGALGILSSDLSLASSQGLPYSKLAPFAFLVATQYLNAQPQVPDAAYSGNGDNISNLYYCGAVNYNFSRHNYCDVSADGSGVSPILVGYPIHGNAANGYATATKVQLQVCQDIANQARGQGAPIDTTYFIDQSTSQFDCAAEDPSNGGTTGYYDFVYRIF